jgi:hypothetical protein
MFSLWKKFILFTEAAQKLLQAPVIRNKNKK